MECTAHHLDFKGTARFTPITVLLQERPCAVAFDDQLQNLLIMARYAYTLGIYDMNISTGRKSSYWSYGSNNNMYISSTV